jgi:hypothetical protein
MGFIDDNFSWLWKVAAVAGAYFYFNPSKTPTVPELPVWTELVVMGGVFALLGAIVASGRIDALLPDPPRVWVFAVNARATPPIQVHKISPDKWAATEHVAGSPLELSAALERAYLVYEYHPDRDVAVGTWLRSKSEAEFVGHHEVSDALNSIGEVRDHLEPMARRGNRIRQHLPAIIRELDYQRMVSQNRAIEGHLTPSFGDDDGVDAVIEQFVPEDLRPDRLQSKDDPVDEEDWSFEILDLDTGDALEPVSNGAEATNGRTQ